MRKLTALSVNDSDFMSVCNALADKLNEKIENEEKIYLKDHLERGGLF